MVSLKPVQLIFDKVYKILIIVGGFTLLFLFGNQEVILHSWTDLSLFVVLLLISNAFRIRLSVNIEYSLAFIIELVVIQLFGMSVAILTTFMTVFLVNTVKLAIERKWPFYNSLFNAALSTCTVAAAGLAYNLATDTIFGFIAATMAYFITDITLLAVVQYAGRKRKIPFKDEWLEIGKEISLNFFVLAPLAYLIPYIFNSVETQNRLFFVLLFFVPVMLVNYAFRLYTNIRQSYLNTVKTLVAVIEVKDPHVRGHAERVAGYALAIARDIGYTDKELTRLHYIALLHDAGKIGIKDRILNKPEALTADEYAEVKRHSLIGAKIIEKINFLSSGADIVRFHHERFDGTGYPAGLRGYDIPEGARILAVVDAFDAMTTDRPYRKAKTKAEALAELESLAGKQFDPQVVKVFKKVLHRQGEI
ncbi:metal dependent phosphohydrolase [Thermincola potens JR]|uniref:Metal dependent phosphohydrolase n=1 Tax=Thermincola potens (strain JR) TaxID=635013 RepID=D5XCS9_THEPJ|nr:metal dependent phosphohydrolase [Thermincola potens JR]